MSCRSFLLACLDQAVLRLRAAGPPSDDSVHDLRRALKRARAALRLMRPAIGEVRYRGANQLLRDAGRAFREVRDAAVLPEVLAMLAKRHPVARGTELDRTLRILRANRLRARRDLLRSSAASEPALRLLKRALDAATQWSIPRSDAGALSSGLRCVYRKGRRGFAKAKGQRATETLHEWRKQVKYLQNALFALAALAPEPNARVAKVGERVSELADALGEDHDLAVLLQELHGDAYAAVAPRTREMLFRLIGRDRGKLQKHILSVAAKVYRSKPRRFAAQFAAA